MNSTVRETSPPIDSRVSTLLGDADFYDAWSTTSDHVDASALEHFIEAVKHAPRWVNLCMALRNRTVTFFGLKNLGHLAALTQGKPASDYMPGSRVGIFTLFDNTFDEVLLGDRDKHLNVVVSVHRSTIVENGKVDITVTTVVHVKNLLGRLYMLPVKPMHRLIAPAVLGSLATTKRVG